MRPLLATVSIITYCHCNKQRHRNGGRSASSDFARFVEGGRLAFTSCKHMYVASNYPSVYRSVCTSCYVFSILLVKGALIRCSANLLFHNLHRISLANHCVAMQNLSKSIPCCVVVCFWALFFRTCCSPVRCTKKSSQHSASGALLPVLYRMADSS